MLPKEIIANFYASDVLLQKEEVKKWLHPEVELEWNSSTGYLKLDFDAILALTENLGKTYIRLKNQIFHQVIDKNKVAIRYKSYVKTIENPREEIPLALFMVIWEIKDDKLYRGFQMSYLP